MSEPFRTHQALQHNVRRLRRARGLTLLELGQAAGIRASAVAQIENGHSADPRMCTCIRLARALGVGLDVLARWDDRDGPRPAEVSQARADQTDE
jgi:transcriptional regulator with XRE-family HTH domain